MPFPSGRCRTCRARHVKCDEQRPVCTPCSKAERSCSWDDSDSRDLVFRHENDFASNRAKRQRGGARRPVGENVWQCDPMPSSQSSQLIKHAPQKIISSKIKEENVFSIFTPKESMETHALNKLLHDFIYVNSTYSSDVWGFLDDYHSDFFPLGSHPTFVPAITAYALAHFGRTKNCEAAMAAGRRYYSTALLGTSLAVQNESSAVEDEVILTAMLLAGFEDVTGNFDRQMLRTQGFSHLQGVTALMRARQQHGKPTTRSTELDMVVRRRVIRSSVHHGVCVPQLIQDGGIYDGDPIVNSSYILLVEVAAVREKARLFVLQFQCMSPIQMKSALAEVLLLASEIQDVDDRLRTWQAQLPEEWQYTSKEISENTFIESFLSGIFFSRTYHEHHHGEVLMTWNRYRGARLITLGILTKIATWNSSVERFLAKRNNFNLEATKREMQYLAEGIAATIPSHFNAITCPPRSLDEVMDRIPASIAANLTWCLIVSSATLNIPTNLRDYFRSKLLLVSRMIGSAVLEMLAGMDLHKRGFPHGQIEAAST